jgi:hypothetical protein
MHFLFGVWPLLLEVNIIQKLTLELVYNEG